MPNWCENNLVITGEENEIKRFKEQARCEGTEHTPKTDLSLDKLYPMPEELHGTIAPTHKPNWWDWRVASWGTKWDVEAVIEYEDETMLEYRFDSAWSPPVQWLEKVAADFPKLSFRLKYEEPAMGFMGIAKAEGGELISDQNIEY